MGAAPLNLGQAMKQTHTNTALSKAREKCQQNREKQAAAASHSALAVSAVGTGDEITSQDLVMEQAAQAGGG